VRRNSEPHSLPVAVAHLVLVRRMEPRPAWLVVRYIALPPLVAFVVGGALLLSTASAHPRYAAVVVAVLVLIVVFAVHRRNRRDLARGWRLRRAGRDQFCYQELIDERWASITIDGEMLRGKPRRVIYMPTIEAWGFLPAWARDRRAEIIARIQSECPEPDYAYQNV
jgi:hypothetical protein